jgi:hypothetical protein
MFYQHKYLKYKLKYLNLKKLIQSTQLGGSDLDYYLPCEISHYTKEIYYSKESIQQQNNNELIKIIGQSDANLFSGGYYQDPYIQLYNNKEKKYFNIHNNYVGDKENCDVFPSDKNVMIHISYDNKGEGEQSKGGNFISAPEIKLDSITKYTIFYIEGCSQEIIEKFIKCGYEKYDINSKTFTKIKDRPNKLLVELKCSFKASESFRHIDELMCFMPYGKEKFKVWFYDKFTESDNLTPPEYKKLLKELFKKKDRGKDWFDEKLSLGKKLPEMEKKYIELLNKERLENLNIIYNVLFNTDYESIKDNKDKFIFLKFYMNKPSLLNRVYIEKNNDNVNNPIIIFPNDEIQKENNKIINGEKDIMLSYITGKPITVKYINVKPANEEEPEGGPHCLIKQRFELIK